MDQKHQTQWAAQFYVAAELTRRGYTATFTLGNTPEADLLAKSPGGKAFRVDVKGLSQRNYWRLRSRESAPDLYYALVHLPRDGQAPEFFLMSSAVAMREVKRILNTPTKTGAERKATGSGLTWAFASSHKDQWSALPQ